MRKTLLLLIASSLLLGVSVHAGDPPEPRKKAVKTIRVEKDRPQLGIVLKIEAGPESWGEGAVVLGVTPGSPADEAGIRAEDVILSVDGVRLAGDSAGPRAPSAMLLDLATSFRDGQAVTLEVKQGGKTRSVIIQPKTIEQRIFWPEGDSNITVDIDDGRFATRSDLLFLNRRWDDLELVSIGPDLGAYFGTTEGLLILRVPENSPFDLRSGDVVLSIGGREPRNPAHAFRILRSYEEGETLTFEILRHGKSLQVMGKVPPEPEGAHPFPKAGSFGNSFFVPGNRPVTLDALPQPEDGTWDRFITASPDEEGKEIRLTVELDTPDQDEV